MNKDMFDDAIGEVPPSTVDMDAVIAGGRRADRFRRVANPAVGVAAAVAVVLGGVAFTLLPDDSAGGMAPGAGPSTTVPSPSPRPKVPTSGKDETSINPKHGYAPPTDECTGTPDPTPTEDPADTRSRLNDLLPDIVLPHLAPNVELVRNPDSWLPWKDSSGPLHAPLEVYAYPWQVTDDCYSVDFVAFADIRQHGGVGHFEMTVLSGRSLPQPDACASYEDGVFAPVADISCTETTIHGATVVYQEITMTNGGVVHRVDVGKPDGTGVIVKSGNFSGSDHTARPVTMPKPPLDREQLTEMAFDPGLTLYP